MAARKQLISSYPRFYAIMLNAWMWTWMKAKIKHCGIKVSTWRLSALLQRNSINAVIFPFTSAVLCRWPLLFDGNCNFTHYRTLEGGISVSAGSWYVSWRQLLKIYAAISTQQVKSISLSSLVKIYGDVMPWPASYWDDIIAGAIIILLLMSAW